MAWCGTFYALAFTTPQTALAVAFLITASMGQHFYMPAMYTLAQDVAPPPMRATSAALMIAIVSVAGFGLGPPVIGLRSEEHTSELQSLMRISYAVLCLQNKKTHY